MFVVYDIEMSSDVVKHIVSESIKLLLILSIIEMSLYVVKDVANEELFVLVKSLDEVVFVVSDRMLLSIR